MAEGIIAETRCKKRQLDPQISEVHGPPLPQPVPGLRTLLAQTAVQYSDKLALVSVHQADDIVPIDFPPKYRLREEDTSPNSSYLRWSHGQLQYAAELLADGLRVRGVQRGQPIATYLSNGVEWAIAFRAATILRCPFVPLNPRGGANATEVEHMLRTSAAKAIIAGDASIASKLDNAAPELIASMTVRAVCEKDASVIPDFWSSFYNLFSAGDKAGILTPPHDTPADSPLEPEDKEVALIVFTSGTTSLPKGGIHTHASAASSLLSQAIALKPTSSHRTCCHMPTHHIGGINIAMGFMIVGGCTVFPSAVFEPAASLQAISLEKCTNLPCVPAILQAIAAQPKLAATDASSLRNVEIGATTILLEHLKLCWSALKCPSMSNSHAATETVPVTTAFFDTRTAESISVGTIVDCCRLRICPPDSRTPLPRGEAGEMHFGGPHLIQGYLGGFSADSFYEDAEGIWFTSGDQGIISEDGTVTISGRYKDLIIRGGENIAPAAIEAVLDAKLKITAQVIGIKSEEAGEVPVAVIQQKDDSVLPTADIRKVLVDALGPAFVPENFYTLQQLGLKDYPRTSSGKVRKVDLKDIVQQHEDASQKRAAPLKSSGAYVDDLIELWQKLIGVEVQPESSVHDFADSITLMRFRNMVKRNLGLDITTDEILEAGTVQKQAELLSSRGNSSALPAGLESTREGPPGIDDIAITLGEPEVMSQIKSQVTKAIAPLGFTWDEDVEDILPSWDLGYEVFGNVAGTAKVNHRMAISTKEANVEELHAALRVAIQHHAMQRSLS
ncbi:Putative AMP-dependent synthetase/ligase, phosphopantetheine binding ACP domain, AMP-binding protein [Septoria linicola]|uniref:AMP-dependent synthetase/ligase, phosphopantetheine binding ACP domain, AMP-binding protein n=1 Tax=Septoria linicola TaxID=215465 RepID=A0A9Q9EN57_9PEZI|nr:putative AMP-dependent synthetase/ligase, phosphopantetheine binding ACP domain, AMP-binding protein [Septoria linicola]USW57451.1 Putative AMP-dependent synthetase/ligase, phosphopantetheine binding ACP domain, AMP-binding protein [Septoria linicola]